MDDVAIVSLGLLGVVAVDAAEEPAEGDVEKEEDAGVFDAPVSFATALDTRALDADDDVDVEEEDNGGGLEEDLLADVELPEGRLAGTDVGFFVGVSSECIVSIATHTTHSTLNRNTRITHSTTTHYT